MMSLFILALKGIGTKHFTVYYPEEYRTQAMHALYYLEKYRKHVNSITGGNPGRLVVVIEDIGVISNGFADPTAPTIHLFTNVPKEFQRSWWRVVSVHEYTHISHLTNVSGVPKFLRFFTGKWFLPNMMFNPLYMIEGVTVFTESSIVPYEGRLNEGYFDAYTDLVAKHRKIPNISYLSHLPANYPGYRLAYLLGSEFTEYLSGDSALNYNPEESMLPKYYTDYGKTLSQLTGIDFPAKRIWKKTRRELYYTWKREQEKKRGYRETGENIRKEYRLSHLAENKGTLYYYRVVNKRVSYDFPLYYGEIVSFNPETKRAGTIVKGYLATPIRFYKDTLYFGLLDLDKNGKNITMLGLAYSVLLFKWFNGKIERLAKDKIKTIAVYNGDVFYSVDKGDGSVIYRIFGKKKEVYRTFDSLLVQDMVFDEKGNLWFIGYLEGDGNNIYMLDKSKNLTRITDFDFSFADLFYRDKSLYFCANYNGRCRAYRYDIQKRKFYLIDADDYTRYPVRDGDFLHYTGIAVDGEVLKRVKYREKEIEFKETRKRLEFPGEVDVVERGMLDDFFTMLFPDAIFPFMGNYYGAGVFGHNALQTNFYLITAGIDTTREFSYDLWYEYRGFAGTVLDVRVEKTLKNTGFSVSNVLYASLFGFLRELDFMFSLYPFTLESSVIGGMVCSPSGDDELGIYGGRRFYLDRLDKYGYELGAYIKRPFSFLSVEPELSYAFSTEGVEVAMPSKRSISGSWGLKMDLRVVFPLFELNRGIELPHFFAERFYLTAEFEQGFADSLRIYNLLSYITTDMSVFSGFLKFSLSLGAGYDPKEGFFPVIGIGTEISRLADLRGFAKRLDSRRYHPILQDAILKTMQNEWKN